MFYVLIVSGALVRDVLHIHPSAVMSTIVRLLAVVDDDDDHHHHYCHDEDREVAAVVFVAKHTQIHPSALFCGIRQFRYSHNHMSKLCSRNVSAVRLRWMASKSVQPLPCLHRSLISSPNCCSLCNQTSSSIVAALFCLVFTHFFSFYFVLIYFVKVN